MLHLDHLRVRLFISCLTICYASQQWYNRVQLTLSQLPKEVALMHDVGRTERTTVHLNSPLHSSYFAVVAIQFVWVLSGEVVREEA